MSLTHSNAKECRSEYNMYTYMYITTIHNTCNVVCLSETVESLHETILKHKNKYRRILIEVLLQNSTIPQVLQASVLRCLLLLCTLDHLPRDKNVGQTQHRLLIPNLPMYVRTFRAKAVFNAHFWECLYIRIPLQPILHIYINVLVHYRVWHWWCYWLLSLSGHSETGNLHNTALSQQNPGNEHGNFCITQY